MMISRKRHRETGVASCLALWLAWNAQAVVGQERLEIAITAPEFGQVVFGPTQVAAEVYPPGSTIERVEFYLDGFLVATDQEAPFEVQIDVGQENREHRFEVVARGAAGSSGSSSVSSTKIESDLEVDVELRQIFATVSNNVGRVTGLPESAFRVLDDGVEQTLVTFSGGDVPFSAVLMVDSSLSMADGKLQISVEGAESFLGDLGPLDEAKLILFSDRVLRETPFSSFSRLILLGLRDVTAEGGSAVSDAVYLGLKRLTPRLSRKVLVLLSDGEDVDSSLPMGQILTVMRREQAVFYWIQLGQSSKGRMNNWRGMEENRREFAFLRQAVVESGGRIVPVSQVSEAGYAFSTILGELRDQYVLGYYPTAQNGPGTWHEVEVQVSLSGDVRARTGYLER